MTSTTRGPTTGASSHPRIDLRWRPNSVWSVQMRLTQDFVEFIECCARRDVRYLVVKGA